MRRESELFTAICVSENAASAAVKIGGEVDDLRGRRTVSSRAGVGKAESVNAVRMLIHEHKGFSRVYDYGQFVVSAPDVLAGVVGFVEPFA
jgi:hypothetical protein